MPLSPLVPRYTGGGQGGAGVPTLDPSPGLPGATAGGFVDAGDYWDKVSAVAIASARAAEQLGSQAMQVAENDAQRDVALVQADMRMRLHSASSGAYMQLKDLESSIEGDASISPLDAGKRWREGAEKIRDEFAKDLSGDPLKVFTEDVDRQIGLGSIRLRDHSAVRLKDSAAAGLMTTLDGLARVAANAKTPAELNEAVGRAQDAMSDAVANGVLTASQAQAQSMRWRGDVDEARLRGAIQTDPAGAIKRIDAGEFQGLPPDRLQQFREHATAVGKQRDREVTNSLEEKYATAYNELAVRVDAGEEVKPEIDDFRRQWSAEGVPESIRTKAQTGWRQLTLGYERAHREKAAQQEATDRVQLAIDSGVGYAVPLEQKDVNAWFAAHPQSNLTQFAVATGQLPDVAKDSLSGIVLQGQPEQQARASLQVVDISEKAPAAGRRFADDVQRRAYYTSDLLAAGLTPAEAADRVRARFDVLPSVADARRAEMTPTWMADRWKDAVPDVREGSPGWWWPGSTTKIPADVQTAMRSAWEQAFRPEYEATGNAAFAAKRATQILKRTWGVSRVDGSGAWMRYPPELAYGNGDPESSDWLRKSFEADLAKAGYRPPGEIRLVGDKQSAAEVAAGRKPTYAVVAVDSASGDIANVMTPEWQVMRWPPATPERPTTPIDWADLSRRHRAAMQEIKTRGERAQDVTVREGIMPAEPGGAPRSGMEVPTLVRPAPPAVPAAPQGPSAPVRQTSRQPPLMPPDDPDFRARNRALLWENLQRLRRGEAPLPIGGE